VEAALPADPYDRAVRVGGAWALADAIAAALAFDESLQDRAEDAAREVGRDTTDPRLTDRELEVLDRIAAGDTNKDIARRLGVSPKTVMHHTMGIYRKLGVRGRAEATAYALRNRLVASPGPAGGDAALR
jgi:DNA-binding NarL/FixJ family response regulator